MLDTKCPSCGAWLWSNWCDFGDAWAKECQATPAELEEARRRKSRRWLLASWHFMRPDRQWWGFGIQAHWSDAERSVEFSLGPFHTWLDWERVWVRTEAIRQAAATAPNQPNAPPTDHRPFDYG